VKKRAKEEEKARRKAEREQKEAERAAQAQEVRIGDPHGHPFSTFFLWYCQDFAKANYGDLPMNQSQNVTGNAALPAFSYCGWLILWIGRRREPISDISAERAGDEVILRARIHNSRAQSTLKF
jgi:hypothetical protein